MDKGRVQSQQIVTNLNYTLYVLYLDIIIIICDSSVMHMVVHDFIYFFTLSGNLSGADTGFEVRGAWVKN